MKVRTKSTGLDSAELAQAALRESDDRYRQLAEHVRDVFWLLEVSTGQVLYLNDAFNTVFGRSAQPVYDDRHEWLAAIHVDDRGTIEDLHSSIADGTERL